MSENKLYNLHALTMEEEVMGEGLALSGLTPDIMIKAISRVLVRGY